MCHSKLDWELNADGSDQGILWIAQNPMQRIQ